MTPIINSALLGLIEQTGTAVGTLVEGLEQSELLRSRLTRGEVLRQLKTLAARAVSRGALSSLSRRKQSG